MGPPLTDAAPRGETWGAPKDASGDIQDTELCKKEVSQNQLGIYCKRTSSALTPGPNNCAAHLQQKERHAISIAAACNINNSNMKQYLQANIDAHKVVDSVYQCVLQYYQTTEALQGALVSGSDTLLEKIANTLIVEMTQLLQPQLSASDSSDKKVDNILEDSALLPDYPMSENIDQLPSLYSASFLEDVFSELLFKIVLISNILVPKDQKIPKCDLSQSAMLLVPSVVKELNKFQIKVVEMKEDTCESDAAKVVDSVYNSFFKLYKCYKSIQSEIKFKNDALAEKIVSLVLEEIQDFQIEASYADTLPPHLYKTVEPRNLAYKVQNLFNSRHLQRPSGKTTVLSCKVLEAILQSLVAKILPSSKTSFPNSELKDMTSKFIEGVKMRFSDHEIWYNKEATFIQRVDPRNADDSPDNDICRTQGAPGNVTANKKETTSRLLFREFSNPNFMTIETDDSYSLSSDSTHADQVPGDNESEETGCSPCNSYIYSFSFLQEVISAISCQIFINIADINESENGIQRSEIQLRNMAAEFLDLLFAEIRNAPIPFTNIALPASHTLVLDTISNIVFSKIYQEYENDAGVYEILNKSNCTFANNVISYVLAAISEYCKQVKSKMSISPVIPSKPKLKPATCVETVAKNIAHPCVASEMLKQSVTVLSSTVLEEIVSKFLSRLFYNCPHLALNTENTSSVSQVKRIAEKLTKALSFSVSVKKIQICPDVRKARNVHPKDEEIIEKVVSDVYNTVFFLSGSHISIYQNLASGGDVLAQAIATLMVAEIFNYHFQPCCPRDKHTDQYLCLESSHIAQQVICDIGGTPSSPKESNCHGLSAQILEQIISQFLTKMFLSSNDKPIAKTRSCLLEAKLSRAGSQLINSVLKEMTKCEMNVIKAADDAPGVQSEDEDFIALVSDSIYLNALQDAGSPLKLFRSLISGSTVVSEKIAGIVIKEISQYELDCFSTEGVACDSYTDMEVSQIVEKMLNDVVIKSSLKSTSENMVCGDTDSCKVQPLSTCGLEAISPMITPHLNNLPMLIDSAITSMHLAVLSIKTLPLEELDYQITRQTGQNLESLRLLSAIGKGTPGQTCHPCHLSRQSGEPNEIQSRASLDNCGRLAVKPKKLGSRNSFLDVLRPDIAKVELLKDATNNQELIIRLVAHDIAYHNEADDVEELVLSDHSCLKNIRKKPPAKKKKCCACCLTGTKDSISERPSQLALCNFNENASAPTVDSIIVNMKFVVNGMQFTNSTSSLNKLANSATFALNNHLERKMGKSESNSFQTGSTLQNCLFQLADTPFSQHRKTCVALWLDVVWAGPGYERGDQVSGCWRKEAELDFFTSPLTVVCPFLSISVVPALSHIFAHDE